MNRQETNSARETRKTADQSATANRITVIDPLEGCQKAFVAEQVRNTEEDEACLDPVH